MSYVTSLYHVVFTTYCRRPVIDNTHREYGAFSLSYGHRDAVYDYIASQQEHHDTISLDDEYRRLIIKAGLQIYGN